jgi:hypothetical protein
VSRRVIRPPEPATSPDDAPPGPEIMHLTPWDLRLITVDYIQKGVLLPKPQTGGEAAHLVVRNRMPVSLRGGGGELGNLKT